MKTDDAVPEKITRQDVSDAQKLLRHVRAVVLKAIEKGTLRDIEKRQTRSHLMGDIQRLELLFERVEQHTPKE